MENWLYEEGEDCSRQIYSDKLASLKVSFIVYMQCLLIWFLFYLTVIHIVECW